jgi:hypothetical protein
MNKKKTLLNPLTGFIFGHRSGDKPLTSHENNRCQAVID